MRRYTQFRWLHFADTGLVLHIEVHSVHPYSGRFSLRGIASVPSFANENVNMRSSAIPFDKKTWMNVEVPSRLLRAIKACLGDSWQKDIIWKVLVIRCLGHSQPDKVYEKSRGTGGHYLFSLSVYDDNATVIAETTTKRTSLALESS